VGGRRGGSVVAVEEEEEEGEGVRSRTFRNSPSRSTNSMNLEKRNEMRCDV
jgi:hypothetical protein